MKRNFIGLIKLAQQTYVIAKGDSLGKIAKKYNVSVDDLAKLNGIVDKNKVSVGQTLKLPGGTQSAQVSVSPVESTSTEEFPDYSAMTPTQRELTRLLYDEARHHTNDMPYIASSVYNRSGGTNYVQNVMEQPKAFSGRRSGGTYESTKHRNDNDYERAAWREAMRQALRIYDPDYTPITTATHFHAPTVSPDWNDGKTPLNITNTTHKFYDDVTFKRPWIATKRPEITKDNKREYAVAEGDTFFDIGKNLGGIPYWWIRAWNPGVNEKQMRPGSKIQYVPLPADYKPLSATGKIIADELNRQQK